MQEAPNPNIGPPSHQGGEKSIFVNGLSHRGQAFLYKAYIGEDSPSARGLPLCERPASPQEACLWEARFLLFLFLVREAEFEHWTLNTKDCILHIAQ